MLSPRRNSLLLLCLLLVGCQKIDLTEEPTDAKTTGATQQATTIVGTGEGTRECPYTPADVRALTLSGNEPVWVAGYVVGTARLTMKNAVFSPEAEKHIRGYIAQMSASITANARTMKLMARTIYQQVILREAGLQERPDAHVVELTDVESLKWDGKKGKIGF